MKRMALALLLSVAAQAAGAETIGDPPGESAARLAACTRLPAEERLACFDALSRELASPERSRPTLQAAPVPSRWFISETTSPVDYTPQIVATNMAASAMGDAPASFSVGCRGGRTDVIAATNGVWSMPSGASELLVAYRINTEPPVEQRWGVAAPGRSLSYKGDPVTFLRALPEDGRLAMRVQTREGPSSEGVFMLAGFARVRDKVATLCGWPAASPAPGTPGPPMARQR